MKKLIQKKVMRWIFKIVTVRVVATQKRINADLKNSQVIKNYLQGNSNSRFLLVK